MTNVEEGSATIAEVCDREGGLVEVTLGDLRTELGYRKLGPGVLEDIRVALAQQGLGYFPPHRLIFDSSEPPRQWHAVWVYRRDGGMRARVIEAILEPDENDVRGALDGLAVGNAQAMTAEQKLSAIRGLVAE